MTVLKIFLTFLLFWLQYSLWWGKNGIFDYIKIYKKVTQAKIKNKNIDILNDKIKLEIKHLNDKIKKNK